MKLIWTIQEREWASTDSQNWHDRSDRCTQAVWLVCSLYPVWQESTGMTGGSDRSMRSPSTIRKFYRFRSVNRISCRVSLPHPINIKCHDRLREQSNRIYQTLLSFYLFLCPNLFQPYVLFVCRLHGVRGRTNWPVETRAIQRALALTGSLLSERSLDLRRATRRNRSDWPTKPVWPDLVEALQGALDEVHMTCSCDGAFLRQQRALGSSHQSPRKLQDANQPNFMALDTWRNLKQE